MTIGAKRCSRARSPHETKHKYCASLYAPPLVPIAERRIEFHRYIIAAAPLWQLLQHRPWQKRLK